MSIWWTPDLEVCHIRILAFSVMLRFLLFPYSYWCHDYDVLYKCLSEQDSNNNYLVTELFNITHISNIWFSIRRTIAHAIVVTQGCSKWRYTPAYTYTVPSTRTLCPRRGSSKVKWTAQNRSPKQYRSKSILVYLQIT